MAQRRAELEEVIKNGGSVLHQGRVITKAEDLPSDIELAGNDVVRKQQALGDIDAQIAHLNKLKAEAEAKAKAEKAEKAKAE